MKCESPKKEGHADFFFAIPPPLSATPSFDVIVHARPGRKKKWEDGGRRNRNKEKTSKQRKRKEKRRKGKGGFFFHFGTIF